MGIPVLVLGASGSGKSTALRNFTADEISIFNVASKPLPFRAKLPIMNGATYEAIETKLKQGGKNAYAIDDSQFLMVFDEFARAKETGYTKFTDFALSFYTLVQTVIRETPPSTVVYFLHHTEMDEFGRTKAKTVGKMLDSKLTLEGMFSVVLLCGTDGTRHWFETNSNGMNTAKTPLDMFSEPQIDNDLKFVDAVIREYWQLDPLMKKGAKKDGKTAGVSNPKS